MENLNTALLPMVVGMVTVFAILLIIIYLGKGLIALVNKYAPEEVSSIKPAASGPAAIPANVMVAISAIVTVVTQGKGKVTKVEKIRDN